MHHSWISVTRFISVMRRDERRSREDLAKNYFVFLVQNPLFIHKTFRARNKSELFNLLRDIYGLYYLLLLLMSFLQSHILFLERDLVVLLFRYTYFMRAYDWCVNEDSLWAQAGYIANYFVMHGRLTQESTKKNTKLTYTLTNSYIYAMFCDFP